MTGTAEYFWQGERYDVVPSEFVEPFNSVWETEKDKRCSHLLFRAALEPVDEEEQPDAATILRDIFRIVMEEKMGGGFTHIAWRVIPRFRLYEEVRRLTLRSRFVLVKSPEHYEGTSFCEREAFGPLAPFTGQRMYC